MSGRAHGSYMEGLGNPQIKEALSEEGTSTSVYRGQVLGYMKNMAEAVGLYPLG